MSLPPPPNRSGRKQGPSCSKTVRRGLRLIAGRFEQLDGKCWAGPFLGHLWGARKGDVELAKDRKAVYAAKKYLVRKYGKPAP